MQTSASSLNLVTILLISMFVLVLLSLLTLAIYFFGGRSPLQRNVKGRIEAAVNPAEVLTAHRQYNRFRLIFTLALVVSFYWILHRTAPAQTEQATNAFLEAISITVRAARDGAGALVQELRSGNE